MVDLNLFKILGHTWDPVGSPLGNTSISRGMGGQENGGVFLILACIHTSTKNFQELNLGKVFVSTFTSKIYYSCFVESDNFF